MGARHIRILGIDAPEIGAHARCPNEAALAEEAAAELLALLNAGPFRLEAGKRDRDRYGRLLRTVTRGGQSLGERLVAEGLAEPWRGHRGDWCILR